MKKVKKRNKKLPKFLQSALWSYDLSSFDPDNPADKKLIIEQVLNYGTDKQLSWVLQNYSKKEIKKAIENPRRGMWYPESLNYWKEVLGVKIDKDSYEKAIKNIYPEAWQSHNAGLIEILSIYIIYLKNSDYRKCLAGLKKNTQTSANLRY